MLPRPPGAPVRRVSAARRLRPPARGAERYPRASTRRQTGPPRLPQGATAGFGGGWHARSVEILVALAPTATPRYLYALLHARTKFPEDRPNIHGSSGTRD